MDRNLKREEKTNFIRQNRNENKHSRICVCSYTVQTRYSATCLLMFSTRRIQCLIVASTTTSTRFCSGPTCNESSMPNLRKPHNGKLLIWVKSEGKFHRTSRYVRTRERKSFPLWFTVRLSAAFPII